MGLISVFSSLFVCVICMIFARCEDGAGVMLVGAVTCFLGVDVLSESWERVGAAAVPGRRPILIGSGTRVALMICTVARSERRPKLAGLGARSALVVYTALRPGMWPTLMGSGVRLALIAW